MSQAASGVAKTAEHKAKIAAAQRRRHAAARALTAVEAFHRGSDTALPSGGPFSSLLGGSRLLDIRIIVMHSMQSVCSFKDLRVV